MAQGAKEWDVFIAHAGEDKADVVEPLAKALKARGLRVWYDRWVLTVGDSLRHRIDEGLAKSRYGVVVLSPSFFGKHWPEHELDGLVQKEVSGEKVILPVWHRVTREVVANYSLPLADRIAASTTDGIEVVADELLEAMGPTDQATGKLRASPPGKDSYRESRLIVIDGVQFETDPDYYTGPQVERRYSTHRVIGGDPVIQDFGNALSTEPLKLRDGAQKLDRATMLRLQALALGGGSHPVSDWLDNEYMAFIVSFTPRASGSLLWVYTMILQVDSIVRLNGIPYVERPSGRAAVSAPPLNLLQNGSFEDGLQHWGTGWLEDQVGNRALARQRRFLTFHGASASWQPVPEGGNPSTTSLRVEHETPYAPNVYSTLSQIVALRRSTNYEVSFWVKAEHVDGQGGLVLRVAPSREDRPDRWDSIKVQVDPGSFDWREYRLRFNSGDEERYDVRFCAEGRVKAWIDNVVVRALLN